MKHKSKLLNDIWQQVPPDYYEKGIRRNLFQLVWHSWKWQTMTDILNNLKIKPLKILDVGCSSGHITSKIADLFPEAETIGLDSYEKSIKFGEKTYPQIKYVLGDAHKLPFKDETFDLITCIETLEHLVDPLKVVFEMKRCLKKGSYILVGQDTDNIFFKIIWTIWTRTYGRVWQDSHLHPFTPKMLESLLKKANLKVKKRKFSHLGLEVFFLTKKI
jgi:ubiquinone/menaquinone biosynthesis C-methylase UbiE